LCLQTLLWAVLRFEYHLGITLGPGASSVEVGSSESIFRSFWGVRLFDAGCDVPVKYVFSSRSRVREERGHRDSEAPLLSRNRRRLKAVKINKKVQRKCKRSIYGQGGNRTLDLQKKKPVVMLSLENRGARPPHHRIYHRRSRVPNGGVRLVRCLDEKFLTTVSYKGSPLADSSSTPDALG